MSIGRDRQYGEMTYLRSATMAEAMPLMGLKDCHFPGSSLQLTLD